MEREQIIRMAQEANRYASNQTGDSYEWHFIRDERFAALVAAAERKECAALADAQRSNVNVLLSYPEQSSAAYNIGIAIRARGEK